MSHDVNIFRVKVTMRNYQECIPNNSNIEREMFSTNPADLTINLYIKICDCIPSRMKVITAVNVTDEGNRPRILYCYNATIRVDVYKNAIYISKL